MESNTLKGRNEICSPYVKREKESISLVILDSRLTEKNKKLHESFLSLSGKNHKVVPLKRQQHGTPFQKNNRLS